PPPSRAKAPARDRLRRHLLRAPRRSNALRSPAVPEPLPSVGLLVELHADDFGDEGGTGRALDLDGVLRGDAHAAIDGFDRLVFRAKPNARARRHLAGKAHPVGPVIEPARTVLDAVERLAEPRHQRQCQIAMGDSLAPRHVALGALDVDMDPLVIAG